MPRHAVEPPYKITTTFGVPDPNAKHGFHAGLDFAVAVGTPVYAMCSGVVYSTADSGNQGITVQLFDGKYYPHVFHLRQRVVSAGARVSEGILIGYSGNTGLSTGPHCHEGVGKIPYLNSKSINDYIDPMEYIKGATMEMFNDGDRTTWLREASVTDVGQYSDLVGKVSFKEAIEKMRNDGLFRPNPGDVVNGFNIFHGIASDVDKAIWTQKSMKDFLFEKVADGVAKMPPKGVKPYDGPELLVEDK